MSILPCSDRTVESLLTWPTSSAVVAFDSGVSSFSTATDLWTIWQPVPSKANIASRTMLISCSAVVRKRSVLLNIQSKAGAEASAGRCLHQVSYKAHHANKANYLCQ